MIKQKLLVIPLVLALAGAGCSNSGATTPTTPTSPSAPSAIPGSTAPSNSAMGGCTNPYYPFKVGSKITYKSTSPSTSSSYTVEVQPGSTSDAHKLLYTITANGKDYPIAQEFTCDGSGIRANGQLELGAAMGGMQVTYTTDSVNGPFMPSVMTVGTNWDTTYNVTIHTTNAALAPRIDGKQQSTHITNTVESEEDVTVPAGTYHAIKVKMDITINSALIPTPVHTTTETWFAKDIGMVKSVSSGSGMETTTEATAVSGF
jgi:hypothetical protein